MKTVLKIVGVLLVTLLLLGVGFFGYVRSEMPKPGEARIEVGDGVVGVLSDFSYVWVIHSARGAVLIDAASEPTGRAVLAELRKEGLRPADVKSILLTHGHFDHWSAAHLFPDAKVYVGPGDRALLAGEKHYMPEFAEKRMGGRPSMPARIEDLKGGEKLDLDGVNIEAISIPGHTDGSMAYLYKHVLFTGDSVMGRDQGRVLALGPRFFSKDWRQNKESLRLLEKLPFDTICDGHSGITRGAAPKLAAFLR